jgi:hypothetical protein
MDPHQVDHHVWKQKTRGGEQVPPGRYIVIGGFDINYDVAIIHIFGDPRKLPFLKDNYTFHSYSTMQSFIKGNTIHPIPSTYIIYYKGIINRFEFAVIE